jgi:hypothetical protein
MKKSRSLLILLIVLVLLGGLYAYIKARPLKGSNTAEDSGKLSVLLDSNGIPYRTRMDPLDELPGDQVDVDGPSNSRVIFKVDEDSYVVYRFNSYLMQNYFAEKINKALNAKGISSGVEIIGRHREEGSIASVTKDLDVKGTAARTDAPSKPVEDRKPAKPVQLTLFDYSSLIAAG